MLPTIPRINRTGISLRQNYLDDLDENPEDDPPSVSTAHVLKKKTGFTDGDLS